MKDVLEVIMVKHIGMKTFKIKEEYDEWKLKQLSWYVYYYFVKNCF